MNEAQKKIFSYILTHISDEKLEVGSRLPTETELAKRFETNRMNAHSAIKMLESENIVERGKKRGTVLRLSYADTVISKLRSEYCDTIQVLTASHELASHIHWDDTTLTCLEKSLSHSEFVLKFSELPKQASEFQEFLKEAIQNDSQAIVIMPAYDETDALLSSLDILREYPGEIFLLDRGLDIHHQWPFHIVSYDPFAEGVMVAKYLKENKLSNICFLAGHPTAYYWSNERLKGLCFGLDDNVESPEKVNVIRMQDQTFQDDITAFIKNNSKPVIVTHNDDYAVRLLKSIAPQKLSAPKDFLLLGFDNNPQHRKYNLTTVAPPTEKVGKVLGKMICTTDFKLSEGVRLNVKVDSSIIERESCRM